jgi:hypothetical protein
LPCCFDYVGHIRIALWCKRGRHADDYGVGFIQPREIAGSGKFFGFDGLFNFVAIYV